MTDRRLGPNPRRPEAARHPLARWRVVRDLTQEQLAERSGVGRMTIARIESSSGDPRVATARRLADALGVAIEDIFTADGKPSPALRAAEQARAPTRRQGEKNFDSEGQHDSPRTS
jgi:transcriptional regulator with XRE-family HTH domain